MENQKGSVRSQGPNIKAISLRRIQSIMTQEARTLTQKPSLFEVVMLNDDVTPMDYVVQTLEGSFYKKADEATSLALYIHQQGEASCGTYTREIAETKTAEVIENARRFNHPLKCVMRKVK